MTADFQKKERNLTIQYKILPSIVIIPINHLLMEVQYLAIKKQSYCAIFRDEN